MEVIHPEGWAKSVGYSNAIKVSDGAMLFLAGQIGWDENQVFHSEDLAPQFEQALKNILALVREAGGGPEHICRITAFCIDRDEYLRVRRDLGKIWKALMGSHFPAMSMIFVADLLDHPAKIELEATAMVPK